MAFPLHYCDSVVSESDNQSAWGAHQHRACECGAGIWYYATWWRTYAAGFKWARKLDQVPYIHICVFPPFLLYSQHFRWDRNIWTDRIHVVC